MANCLVRDIIWKVLFIFKLLYIKAGVFSSLSTTRRHFCFSSSSFPSFRCGSFSPCLERARYHGNWYTGRYHSSGNLHWISDIVSWRQGTTNSKKQRGYRNICADYMFLIAGICTLIFSRSTETDKHQSHCLVTSKQNLQSTPIRSADLLVHLTITLRDQHKHTLKRIVKIKYACEISNIESSPFIHLRQKSLSISNKASLK